MPNIKINSEYLLKGNYVDVNAKTKEFSNCDFWHYAKTTTINSILETGKIWINSFDKMNDLNEAELHSNVKSNVFALCFCNTNSEKIPMWYLYAGICGRGMRMGMTPSKMLSFIKSIDEIYPVENECVSDTPIKIGTGFSMNCGWIYYRKNRGTIKHKGKWYDVDENDYDKFEKDNYFIKDYPWEYEKEFRIVFENKSGRHIDRIAVNVPQSIINGLKLSFAPEADYEDIMHMDGFREYLNNKIGKSNLMIKMDLLSRNKRDIVRNMKDIIDNSNAEKVCEVLREGNFCKNGDKKD